MVRRRLFYYKKNYLQFLKYNILNVCLDDFRKVYDEECTQEDLAIVCKDMPKSSLVYRKLKYFYDKKYYTSCYEGQRGVYYIALAKAVCGFKKVWEENNKVF
ncbi:hypothetical protein Z969_05610 [Clostridium novyi A str. 4570]|uniref:Uncharacterized protein n=1 Tax=Clostridium novyi A str. 4570 TaxID=1444290 RepID=A0AA88ZTG5_CLONO|nr:hypothetical protein [Clostridium novyi]KGN02399.1 hypothetical protein Z969_05610 [Clostridium novyi A str. 4570]